MHRSCGAIVICHWTFAGRFIRLQQAQGEAEMLQIIVSVIVGAAFWYGAQYGPGIEWVLAVLAFGLTYQAMQTEKALKEIRETLQKHGQKLFANTHRDEEN